MSPLVSLGETPENKNLYKEVDQCAESSKLGRLRIIQRNYGLD